MPHLPPTPKLSGLTLQSLLKKVTALFEHPANLWSCQVLQACSCPLLKQPTPLRVHTGLDPGPASGNLNASNLESQPMEQKQRTLPPGSRKTVS